MILKNLLVPLIPFFFEILIKVCAFSNLKDKKFSDYVDTNNLLITITIWMMFILSMSPKKLSIPTDTIAKDALDATRMTLSSFIMVGLMSIGMMSGLRAIVASSPILSGEVAGKLIDWFSIFSIVFFLICLLFVGLKSKEIREMVS